MLGLNSSLIFDVENRGLSRLNELTMKYFFRVESGGSRPSEFYKTRMEAFSALYSELGLTGDQIGKTRCWQFWR